MTRLHSYPLLAVLALLCAACGDDSKRVTPPTQSRITLNTANATLVAGDSVRLSWTLTGFQTAPDVTLSSSDADVASVAASGWVRAVAPGSARIIARAGDAADTTDVQVTQRAVALAFTEIPDTAAAGSGDVALHVRVTDVRDDGVAGIPVRLTPLYEGAQQSTVTTGEDGVAAFAVSAPTDAGDYRFEASVAEPTGLAPDTATLVVTAADAAVLAIAGDDELALQVGDTIRLTTSFTDAFGNPAGALPIVWVTSNDDVAVVADGLVEATGAGMASIIAVSDVLRDSVRAVVTLPPPSNATIAPASASFTALLDTVQFALTLTTPQGDTVHGEPVSWSVLDAAVASVDANGRVVAVGPGATRVVGTSGALSDTADITVTQVPASVAITPTSVALNAIGASSQLSAAVSDANDQAVAGGAVTWSSLDGGVATVDANGVVTATGNGGTSIVALAGTAADTVNVNVQQTAASIEISPDGTTLDAIGATAQLTASVRDAGGEAISGASVAWSSLDEGVATVDAGGLVTAVADGSTQVVATSGAIADTVSVSVQQAAASVEISPDGDTLDAIGATTQLAATVRDAGGESMPGASIAWSSLDEGVATVDAAGLVTAVANGGAQIVAAASAVADTVTVTVQQQIAAVGVTPDSATLDALGATTVLTAVATDGNGHAVAGTSFTWSSLDEAVATVDAAGVVTSQSDGVAGIVAQTGAFADTSVVTVAQAAATMTITLPADTMRLEGETQQLTVEYYDGNGVLVPGITSTWSSSADSIASVDATGLVTAGAANGSAWIRASGGGITDSVSVAVRDVAFVLLTAANSDTVFNIQVGMFGGPPARAYIYSDTGELLATRTGPTINYTFPAVLDGTVKRVEIKANRAQVQQVEAAQDAIVGDFPEGLLDLPNLAVINLAINPGLTGSLPAEFGTLTNLAALELFSTGLSGPLPANFDDLTGLDILNLSDTQLSGPVSLLAPLATLWYLDLGEAGFTGTMPDLSFHPELIQVHMDASGLNAYGGGLAGLEFVTTVNFADAGLSQADVDQVLADLATSVAAVPRTGEVDLGGTNAAPSVAAQASINALQAAGWTVTLAP